MKKLLILLFSLFFLSSSSVFADDISDFEIEGISIGDSLLDYMTEDEILKEIEITKDWYSYLNESNKYAAINFQKNFQTYDFASVFVKNNYTNQYVSNKNEKYTIVSVSGIIIYNEDFDSCIVKRDEIVEVLSTMFSNAQKTEADFINAGDPSGESIIDGIYFTFDSGAEIDIVCKNWKETFRIKNNYDEGLTVRIMTAEVDAWIRDY